jgi:uncharacterized coiled-coil protein SlyX
MMDDAETIVGGLNDVSNSVASNPMSALNNRAGVDVGNYNSFTQGLAASSGSDEVAREPASEGSQAISEEEDEVARQYDAQIAQMQKKLEDMQKKLDDAEKKKQEDEMVKLNEAIAKATSTINKLQSDKKKLVEKLANNPKPAQVDPLAQKAVTGNSSGITNLEKPLESAVISASGNGVPKPGAIGDKSSFSAGNASRGYAVDANGVSNDEHLYNLRQGSMEGQTGPVLVLSSLKDPSIGARVRDAYKSGDKFVYANVNGAVYRIIPQLDSSGNIVEKGGEIVYITEIVGGEIDSELKEMQGENALALKDEKSSRSPASVSSGMEQQGQTDDVKFGYDAMKELTDEALAR